MAKPLPPDALWERIEPLPPPPPPKRSDRPGRDRIEDRKCLTGILFVLKTGINWEDLPFEMGCGSGMTCWRRLAEWTAAGIWSKRHELLLAELQYAGRIDWSRATIDSAHVRARGGERRHTIYLNASPEYGKQRFFDRLDREIDRIKAAYPEATYVGLADGAKENWLDLDLKTSVQVVDFFHATHPSERRPARCSPTTRRACGRGSTSGATVCGTSRGRPRP